MKIKISNTALFGLLLCSALSFAHGFNKKPELNFNRVSTFPVCMQINDFCDTDEVTAAEIVAASKDGLTLIYSDSPAEQVGFVDITDPASPLPLGVVALHGEPTSVAVKGAYVLVGVNTSENFVNVSGELAVIEISSQRLVATIDLGGQPDSVSVSPDGKYAAVVIENERDEDLGDGAPPQLPAGSLIIVKLTGAPASWTTRVVDLRGIADLYTSDPEPEYVDINEKNIAVVTLQENNYLVLVDLKTGNIVNHFSAGALDLDQIDTKEEGPAIISLTNSQEAVLREPDGVAWIDNKHFATADEGDLDGGSRSFTVFNTRGDVVFTSGNMLDHIAVRLGHYPDARSGNKGNEPENIEVATFGKDKYLFVASERSSLVFVFDIKNPSRPLYKQTLPAGAGPEGVLALPSRNLLIAASEEDSRDDKIRSSLNIYQLGVGAAQYPTLSSVNRRDGTPIPWGALSGLSADLWFPNIMFAVDDSYYQQNRIFTIRAGRKKAKIIAEHRLLDLFNVFANIKTVALDDTTVDDDDDSRINVFDEADLNALINDDKSINIDPEGIAKSWDGGFWIASEGSGTVGDADRPINSLNFLIKTSPWGVIKEVVTLPEEINAMQLRFGFEGVSEYAGNVYVAFQRAWGGEANPRIGIYNSATKDWQFLFYPLDRSESQNGGWVGLSDIASLGGGDFLVVERDNQGGPDAAIKRLYKFNVDGLEDGATLTKVLVRDLMEKGDLAKAGGLTPEKIEGLAVMRNGNVYIVNDNDGVDENSGETLLLKLGKISKHN